MSPIHASRTALDIGGAGGFEDGTTAMYNGSVIVERSLQLDQPVVYVSVNYR